MKQLLEEAFSQKLSVSELKLINRLLTVFFNMSCALGNCIATPRRHSQKNLLKFKPSIGGGKKSDLHYIALSMVVSAR